MLNYVKTLKYETIRTFSPEYTTKKAPYTLNHRNVCMRPTFLLPRLHNFLDFVVIQRKYNVML
jgi:hypothetical protein